MVARLSAQFPVAGNDIGTIGRYTRAHVVAHRLAQHVLPQPVGERRVEESLRLDHLALVAE